MQIAYIGLDAGGSKIEAVGKKGSVLKTVTIPSVNARFEGPTQTVDRLIEAVKRISNALGHSGEIRLCAGLAGVASEASQQDLRELLARAMGAPAAHISIVSDALVAFQAAFPAEEAGTPKAKATTAAARPARREQILVIAGTGSGCYSFGPKREFYRTGGWGSILGDPGSGSAIGNAAIRHLLESLESGQPTPLSASIWKALRSSSAEIHASDPTSPATVTAVLDYVYKAQFKLATLAPVVMERFPHDPSALQLIQSECHALSTQVSRLATTLGSNNPEIVLAGGLSEIPSYVSAFENAIKDVIHHATVSRTTRKPVEGALDLALEMD